MPPVSPIATPERAAWLTQCAREALVRSGRASTTSATDHAAQASDDACEALACILCIPSLAARLAALPLALDARDIFIAAQALIAARPGDAL